MLFGSPIRQIHLSSLSVIHFSCQIVKVGSTRLGTRETKSLLCLYCSQVYSDWNVTPRTKANPQRHLSLNYPHWTPLCAFHTNTSQRYFSPPQYVILSVAFPRSVRYQGKTRECEYTYTHTHTQISFSAYVPVSAPPPSSTMYHFNGVFLTENSQV